MIKIHKTKGEDKTLELIKLSHQTYNYIVCYNKQEAYRIQQEAKELNYSIPFPITYDEFIKKEYHGKNIQGFLIDNADELLQYMSRIEVKAVSLTVDQSDEKVRVSIVQDDSSHWYVIPYELEDDFYKTDPDIDADDEQWEEFTVKYSKYMVGGDINSVPLFANIGKLVEE